MLEGAKYYKFKVKRKTDLGYMLETNLGEEVLMFYKEATKEFEVGEELSAFIYYDKVGRLCATSKEVYATANKIGLLKVVDVDGNKVYLDNNTSKDVLLSTDYIGNNPDIYPEVGDSIFVILKDKKKSLVAKTIKSKDIKEFNPNFMESEYVDVIVEEINDKGILTFSSNMTPVFIPSIYVRGSIRLGQTINVHITKIDNNICYAGMTQNKEKQMSLDEDIILDYLKANHNKMPFTAKSSSASITNTFKISRKAFKRAYGQLYKDGKIYFDEHYTYLK